jgi:hypothetical protein
MLAPGTSIQNYSSALSMGIFKSIHLRRFVFNNPPLELTEERMISKEFSARTV